MSKKLTFTLTLEFETSIDNDNDVLQVAQNVASAIVNGANREGIAPQDSDTFLENVSVKPMFIKEVITQKA